MKLFSYITSFNVVFVIHSIFQYRLFVSWEKKTEAATHSSQMLSGIAE